MSTAPDLGTPTPSTATNVLDDALARVKALDPALAATLFREVDALRDGRRFGLVFEKHLPEAVRLPQHPIRRGVKVALRAPGKTEQSLTWRVLKATGSGAARVAELHDGTTRPVDELVVVRDFGEPVYLGLQSVERIERGTPTDPTHVVINGENHHALQALRYTHRGAVDLIYIDPPYNTGNEGWIYNDRYVAEQDAYKHSKWLSFMERRLTVARDLLKDTGVIIVAIGDDEHHRLRMLMDQVFGSQNFLANLNWQGNTSALAKHTGGGVDYMLIYARDRQAHIDLIGQWKTPKDGVDEVLAVGRKVWDESGHDPQAATEALKAWWRKNKSRFDSSLPVYDRIDETGRIYFAGPLGNTLLRVNLQYDLLHPVTGKPVRMPPNGWAHSKERMAANVEAGLIIFGPDHTTTATYKQYLEEFATQVPLPSFRKDRRSATLHLQKVLGDKRFPFPKDRDVLMRWFKMVAPRDAVILDFFGGSGTTTEAVLRLNAEDGGTRQSILVTNNEVAAQDAKALSKEGLVPGDAAWDAKGVFEYVTRPRLSTVVSGVRPDGTTYDTGLDANIEFFNLTYLDPDRVSRAREFETIAPLLWMKAGGAGARVDEPAEDGWAITTSYGVLFDVDEVGGLIQALVDAPEPTAHVFVVTDSDSDFEDTAWLIDRANPGCVVTRLYESYLRNFEINVEGQ